MLHKEFWGLVFLAFVVWIFFTGDPQVRISRTCRPLMWTGNVLVSLTAFASSSGAESVQGWTNKTDYACRYTVWRLFYQDEYNRVKAAQGTALPADPSAAPAASAPAAPGAPAARVPAQAPAGITPAVVPSITSR